MKTNATRMLTQHKIPYTEAEFDPQVSDSQQIAQILGQDPSTVYKTLVTVSPHNEHFVFVLPVNQNLDLKKAAISVNVKSLSMLKQAQLLPLTGYVHLGCSPLGMKKFFTTVIDISAQDKPKIYISGGRRGYQIGLSPNDLSKAIPFTYASIT